MNTFPTTWATLFMLRGRFSSVNSFVFPQVHVSCLAKTLATLITFTSQAFHRCELFHESLGLLLTKILATLFTFIRLFPTVNSFMKIRFSAWLKHVPHCLIHKVFSPVLTLLWVLRFPNWLKHLSHCLHSFSRYSALRQHLPVYFIQKVLQCELVHASLGFLPCYNSCNNVYICKAFSHCELFHASLGSIRE